MSDRRVVIIGLGGIGTHLVEPLARVLAFAGAERGSKRIILIDGDRYEEKNRRRQRFEHFANKAETTAEWLSPIFPELEFSAKPVYIDEENVFTLVREGDIVFMCVDNHATRKVLSEHLETLENAILFSGGNDEADGNVQIFIRKDGNNLTPSLTEAHEEIATPSDINPATLGCEEIVASGGTQTLAANLMAATLMTCAYATWEKMGELAYKECYFDTRSNCVRAVRHGQM